MSDDTAIVAETTELATKQHSTSQNIQSVNYNCVVWNYLFFMGNYSEEDF